MMIEKPDSSTEDFLYGLVVSRKSGDRCPGVFFAARASGLFSSIDGINWRMATESIGMDTVYSATAVALSPDFENDGNTFLGLAGGLLYSENAGNNWSKAILPNPPPVISCLAVSPDYEHDGILLAGTLEDGVLRSADRGSRFVAWNFGLLDLSIMSLAISEHFSTDETVFAGAESGLFRSTNGGRAWREVETPFGYDPVMSLVLSRDFGREDQHSGILFIGTETRGLYRSDDRGKNWTTLGEELFTESVQSIVLSPAFPEDPGVVVVCGGNVFYSPDGGQSWRMVWDETTRNAPVTALLAPQGFQPGVPIWLGLANGEVLKLPELCLEGKV